MLRFTSLFQEQERKKKDLIRKLRRLLHQRNYWRNRTRELRGRRRR